jgi:hypothetical protein
LSFLEHAILDSTVELTENNAAIPDDAFNLSFKDGGRQSSNASPDQEKRRLLKLHSRAANIEPKRHKVAHGLWTWDAANPTIVTAFSQIQPVKEEAFQSFADLASERGGHVSRSALLHFGEKSQKTRRPREGNANRRTTPAGGRKGSRPDCCPLFCR